MLYREDVGCVQDGGGDKTDVFSEDEEFDFDGWLIVVVVLYITVEDILQFRMNEVEVFA